MNKSKVNESPATAEVATVPTEDAIITAEEAARLEAVAAMREQHKLILANLPASIQAEADKVYTAAVDLHSALGSASQAADSAAKTIGTALSLISRQEGALKDAGFKSYAKFAEKVFDTVAKPASLSQWKKVADKFFTVDKAPICAAWFTVSKLHELRNVSAARLDADASAGILKQSMTQDDLRKYANKVSMEIAKPAVVPIYDGYVYVYAETDERSEVRKLSFNGLTEEEVPGEARDYVSYVMNDDARGTTIKFVSVTYDAIFTDSEGNKSKVKTIMGRFLGGHVMVEYWKWASKPAPAPVAVTDLSDEDIDTMSDAEREALIARLSKKRG